VNDHHQIYIARHNIFLALYTNKRIKNKN